MNSQNPSCVIIGAGPAGLTAAYEMVKKGIRPLVLERSDLVGGISRTEQYKGYRFDIGGHRFFTKVSEVETFWHEVLGDEFIRVPRMSRIHYQGRFFSYPLEAWNAVSNLGLYESTRMVLSYLKWRVRPHRAEETFEEWVMNRFGGRLYAQFFKTYTEKVWGIPCTQIRSDWAAQRIKGLSLKAAVMDALFRKGGSGAKSLIKEFDYPALGPGQMWERVRDLVIEKGGEVLMKTDVVGLSLDGDRVASIRVQTAGEAERTIVADQFINTMALDELVARTDSPPPEVVEAAQGLAYRDFLIVCLIMNKIKAFPDNWIYIHTPGVQVGRIQNFGNWSQAMLADPDKTSLGMEYFCNRGDDLWRMKDEDLIRMASAELEELGLGKAEDVEDGRVIRQEKAYPVYNGDYRRHLDVIRLWVERLENFQTVGRNGMHRYNNQDHSMLTAMLAVRNLDGENHDLWEVNTERSYHEDFQTKDGSPKILSKNDNPKFVAPVDVSAQ